MAKNVFRPTEIVSKPGKIMIETPFEEEPEEVEVQSLEEYTGPTADDLRREAELFKANWDKERNQMMEEARQRAEAIINEAEQKAFDELKRKQDDAARTRQEAQEEARRIIAQAEAEAQEKIAKANSEVGSISAAAEKEGYTKGSEAGYQEGMQEVDRLINQLHKIIDGTISKRNEIIDESETQLINLVLLVAKKVVKVISENQKNVVINNVIQALRKLKSRGSVVIRVNLQDVQLTTEHVQNFTEMVENVKSITVMEDSTVDPGGCIIETDFGSIDARISSQLNEIEEKILELTPIKTKGVE